MHRRFAAAAVLAWTLALPGPAGADAQGRPAWFDAPPTSAATRYFTGSADDAATPNAAVENARKAALARLAESFGQRLQSTTEVDEQVVNGQTSSAIRVQVTSRSQSLTIREVRDVKRESQPDGRGRYSGWALVSIPDDEYRRVQADIAALLRDQADQALRRYRSGEAALRAGRPDPAAEDLREAKTLAADLDPAAPLPDAELGKVTFLVRAIDAMLAKAMLESGSARATVAIRVSLDVDGDAAATRKATDQFVGDLVQAVAGAGLKAAAGEGTAAAWVLEVRAESAFASEISGQYFANASGTYRLVEASTGRELAGGDLGQSKGGHVRRPDACLKALGTIRAKLREAAGPALGKAAGAGNGR